MCEAAKRISDHVGPSAVHELAHEDLVANPKGTLKQLCTFLGVSSSDAYYDDCASIIYKAPHKTRAETEWTPDLKNSVQEKISRFRFLQRYSYDD